MTNNDKTRLLIVDDDPEICELVSRFLVAHGFDVDSAADGAAMRKVLASRHIDLIILDLMLPGENGLDLCREVRVSSSTPIVMLTAAGDLGDRIDGLEAGADDYVPKPFSSHELLARIKAVLRRSANRPADVIGFSGWILDLARRRLTSPDGVRVELSGGEFTLLAIFVRNPQKVMNRDDLLDLTYGRIAGPMDRSVDVQVGRLRRKIETDPKNPDFIKTVRGGGYVFTGVVE